MHRAIPMIAWCVLVLAGMMIIVWRADEDLAAGPVAARFLPRNTLLLEGELTHKGFTGRYVVAQDGVSKGVKLRSQDVADQPAPPSAPPVKLLISLPLAWSAIMAGFNAGSTPQLCGKAQVSFGVVNIQWVQCQSDKPDANCSAVVEIPASGAADIATKALKDQSSTGELHLAANCS